MKKGLHLFVCFVILLFAFTGCNKKADEDKAGEKTKRIGISMPTKMQERWQKDARYLKTEFEKEGYSVVISYADNIVERQIEQIKKLIANKVDVLIIAAIDGESLSSVMKRAKKEEIPVICYERMIRNTDAVSYYVSFDNYKVGKLHARHIVEALELYEAGKKSYTMEILAGDPADSNAHLLYKGAMSILQKYIDNGNLVIPSGQVEFQDVGIEGWDTAKALNRMEYLLDYYYIYGKNKLDICYCANDSIARGVAQAVNAGYMGSNTPVITGQDGDQENLEKLIDGKQSMTVYKPLKDEASVTVELVRQIIKGNSPGKEICKKFAFDAKYDKDSYDNGVITVPSYLLSPLLVTRDNYKSVLIDSGYYKEDENGYLQAVE